MSGLLLALFGFVGGSFNAVLLTLYSWVHVLAPILLAVGLLILAFGARGEGGIMGRSRAGAVAAVTFAAATLGSQLLNTLDLSKSTPLLWLPGFTGPILTNLVLIWISFGSLLVMAVLIFRAGVGRGFTRWGLVLVAALTEAPNTWSFLPWPRVDQAGLTVGFEIASGIYLAGVVVQVVVGIGYALTGQAVALRHAAKAVNDRW